LISDALEQVRLKDREKSDKLWRALLAEAQANRWNGRAGRRFDSLNKLTEAAAIAHSLHVSDSDILQLRNELIACLALPDLRVSKAWQFQKGDPEAFADFREYVNPEHVCFDANLEHYAAVDSDGNIRLHRVNDNQEIARLTNPRKQASVLKMRLMDFSPDGRLLGVINAGSEVLIWEWRRQVIAFQRVRDRAELTPELEYSALDWSSDGRRLALGRRDGAITILDVDSGQVIKEFGSAAPLKQLAWHPNGNELAVLTSADNGPVFLYDIRNGARICAFEHPAALHRIAWRDDGRFLVAASENKHIYISDVPARRPHSVLKAHQGAVIQVAFSHGGNLLASLGWDSTLRLWNPWTGKELVSSPVFGGRLQFSGDDRYLSATLSDGRLALWEVVTGPALRTLYCPSGASGRAGHTTVLGIDFSPDGRLLAGTEMAAGIRLWDLASRNEAALALLPAGWSGSVIFDPDGRSLLTTGVTRWPIAPDADARGTLRIGPPEHLGSPADRSGIFSLSDDGQTLAMVHGDQARGTVRDLSHPADRVELRPHKGIRHAEVSPDCRWVATSTYHDYGTKVWDARTGRLVRDLHGGGAWIGFSPDGQWLLVGELAEYVFWRVDSWESGLRIRRGAPVNLGYGAFVRDGTCLAIVPSQYEVRLVDPATGQEFATLPAPEPQEIFALKFSPDGSHLAVGTSTNMIQLWDLRVLRRQLAALNLDWSLPLYAEPAFSETSEPLRITVVDTPQKSGMDTKETKKNALK
jgi:WD40 repeat protein